MSTHRTIILEAHDGSRWRSLSELPTYEDAKINQPLLWENPSLSPRPRQAEDFPPLPADCSEGACSRLKGVAYWVKTCLNLAEFKAGVKNVARAYKNHSPRAMFEMQGAIAMAEVLASGNIPVRFIIFLDC
ncbi:MAG: hypothetical protein HC800_04585 [Phormidesmis sp. RL_2_1]|nr:hypothetical protein [Phormidesmis sp. RL_2_1]